MAITITTTYSPSGTSLYNCIYNPLMYGAVFNVGATVYTDLKYIINLYNHRTADSLIAQVKFDAYTSGGVTQAWGDVSEILKSVFTTPIHISSGDFAIDTRASLSIKVGYQFSYRDSVGALITSAEAFYTEIQRPMRSVAQIGESKDMDDYEINPIKFLSDFDKIYMFQYAGALLPSELDFILPSGIAGASDLYVGGTGGQVTIPDASLADEVYHVKPLVGWNNTQVFITDNVGTLSELKYAKLYLINENPFFVRWLNQRGAFDYWCFQKRQTDERQGSEMKTIRSYIENPETATGTHTKIDMSAARKMIAGATNLTYNQWDVISWLQYSPLVEYYDIATATWIKVIVEPTKLDYLTDKPAGKLEFSFVFPELILQY